jgi:hypothetical protein
MVFPEVAEHRTCITSDIQRVFEDSISPALKESLGSLDGYVVDFLWKNQDQHSCCCMTGSTSAGGAGPETGMCGISGVSQADHTATSSVRVIELNSLNHKTSGCLFKWDCEDDAEKSQL